MDGKYRIYTLAVWLEGKVFNNANNESRTKRVAYLKPGSGRPYFSNLLIKSNNKKMKLQNFFSKDGMQLSDKNIWKDGGLIGGLYELVAENYQMYPSSSDLVALYYAFEFACETHGNYEADLLYGRAGYPQ